MESQSGRLCEASILRENPKCWSCRNHGISAKESYVQEQNQPKRKNCVAVNRAGRSGSSEESLLSGIMLLGLEFALLSFSLALVQYFITLSLSFRFGMVVCILCHCMLEAYNLRFEFGFTGCKLRDCLES